MSVLISRERVRGLFIGTAIGDALGMPLETLTAAQIKEKYGRVTTYMAAPPENKHAATHRLGSYTDDTQLTLAVAMALIEDCGVPKMDKIAYEHVKEYGIDHSTWGKSTAEAVKRYAEFLCQQLTGAHWSCSGDVSDPKAGYGNGVIMKAGPLAVVAHCAGMMQIDWPEFLKDFTYMTHPRPTALEATFGHVTGLNYCLQLPINQELNKIQFLGRVMYGMVMAHSYLPDVTSAENEMVEQFRRLGAMFGTELFGTDSKPTDSMIHEAFGEDNFMVRNSMPLSYAYFLRKPRSMEALYDAVNAGGDTDSNGALVGGLLGALNGAEFFPQELIDGIRSPEDIPFGDMILEYADGLYATLASKSI